MNIRLASTIAILLATAGCQQRAMPSASIAAAAEPFEALTEEAATVDWHRMDALIATARKEANAVRSRLPASSATALDAQIASVAQARRAQDRLDIALASVEGYRTLIEAQDPATARPPIPVSLLDYAGFRYDALAHSPEPNWEAMSEAASFARGQWASVKPQVKSAALSGVVDSALQALDEAANRKDAGFAQSAAATELALVDLLEEQVSSR